MSEPMAYLYTTDDEPVTASPKDTLKVISFADIPEPGPVSFLVNDFIPEGHISLLYGDGGAGKSYLALCLAACIATGKPFLDRETQSGKVLYVDFELDTAVQGQRAYCVARGLGLEKPPSGLLYCSRQDVETTSLNAILYEIEKEIEEDDIKLTVIDSFGAAVEGDPEAARDVCAFFRKLKGLGTVLMLDHQSKLGTGQKYKDKTAFGSVYKTNLSRNVWQLQGLDSTDGKAVLAMHHKKTNFGPLRDSLGLTMNFGQSFTVELSEISAEHAPELGIDYEIKTYLKEKDATAEEMADATGHPVKTIKNHLTRLKGAGKVIDTGERSGNAHIYGVPASLPYSSWTRDDIEAECEEPSELVLDL